MKLPDFLADDGLNQLRRAMSADLVTPDLPPIWPEFNLDEILQKSGVLIKASDIEILDKELYYNGRRILLYLKEQRRYDDDPGWVNKYHIAHCITLQSFTANRRIDRYVAASRRDGQFMVDMDYYSNKFRWQIATPYKSEKNELVELRVCKNCLRIMKAKYDSEQELWNFDDFSLDEFFKQYETTHDVEPRYTDMNYPGNEYTEDWAKLSKQVREEANWTCVECGRDFSDSKNMFHTHHKDGNKQNNYRDNLQALCHECHRKQPGHEHLTWLNLYP